jgi:hypothetical protein
MLTFTLKSVWPRGPREDVGWARVTANTQQWELLVNDLAPVLAAMAEEPTKGMSKRQLAAYRRRQRMEREEIKATKALRRGLDPAVPLGQYRLTGEGYVLLATEAKKARNRLLAYQDQEVTAARDEEVLRQFEEEYLHKALATQATTRRQREQRAKVARVVTATRMAEIQEASKLRKAQEKELRQAKHARRIAKMQARKAAKGRKGKSSNFQLPKPKVTKAQPTVLGSMLKVLSQAQVRLTVQRHIVAQQDVSFATRVAKAPTSSHEFVGHMVNGTWVSDTEDDLAYEVWLGLNARKES